MSLVDYASSDEEDVSVRKEEEEEHHHQPQESSSASDTEEKRSGPSTSSSPSPALPSQPSAINPQSTPSTMEQQLEDVSSLLPPIIEKLPDASLLLNSPILSGQVGNDHSSRVAAAMASNALRKREANGSSSSYTRGKIPKSNLPHSKNIPDTGGSQLVPPQLRGRSNVVTEDLSKLFVQTNSQRKS